METLLQLECYEIYSRPINTVSNYFVVSVYSKTNNKISNLALSFVHLNNCVEMLFIVRFRLNVLFIYWVNSYYLYIVSNTSQYVRKGHFHIKLSYVWYTFKKPSVSIFLKWDLLPWETIHKRKWNVARMLSILWFADSRLYCVIIYTYMSQIMMYNVYSTTSFVMW